MPRKSNTLVWEIMSLDYLMKLLDDPFFDLHINNPDKFQEGKYVMTKKIRSDLKSVRDKMRLINKMNHYHSMNLNDEVT